MVGESLKLFYCRQNLTPGLDVIFDTKIQKKFGSHNGSLAKTMDDSEDTKHK